jgi:general secretion pathway protein K
VTQATRSAHRDQRRESGVVLALVLVIALLLSASIVTFARRAVIDTMVVRNREDAASAEAMARGGLRLASAILIHDRMLKNLQQAAEGEVLEASQGNTPDDLWSRVGDYTLADTDGNHVRVQIRDAGSLLNLNAIVPYTGKEEQLDQDAEEFLVTVLEKVIDEMDVDPAEKGYDARELSRNLLDWIDVDEFRGVGGPEDDYYLGQDPPYKAANVPLTSVDELGLIEGFDGQLVSALRPYVTVYPVVGGTGINLNTAPPHVLALTYWGVGGSRRLSSEDTVMRILKLREDGTRICTEGGAALSGCVPLSEVGIDEGSVFPPAKLPDESDTFTVTVRATVKDIDRTLTAVIDREKLTEPQLLFWRIQ